VDNIKSRFSHIEINAIDYGAAIRFYDVILLKIGFVRTNCTKTWTAYSDGQTKLIICPVDEEFIKDGFIENEQGLII